MWRASEKKSQRSARSPTIASTRDRGRRGPVARPRGEPEQRDAETERQRRAAQGLCVLPRNAKDEFVGQKCPLRVAGVEQPRLRNADTRRPNALRHTDRLLERQRRFAAAIGGAVMPVAELDQKRRYTEDRREPCPADRLAAVADGERDCTISAPDQWPSSRYAAGVHPVRHCRIGFRLA